MACTVTPPPDDTKDHIGRILLKELKKWKADERDQEKKSWFATILFSYIISNNPSTKSLLFKNIVDDSDANPIPPTLFTTLLQEIKSVVQNNGSPQILIGFLRLLSEWIYNCNEALSYVIKSPSHVSVVLIFGCD